MFCFHFDLVFFFFSFFDIYIQQRQEAQNDNPTRLWILRRMFLNVRTSISKQCGLPPHVQHFVSFRLTVQYFWHAVDDAPKIVWEHACCVFSDSDLPAFVLCLLQSKEEILAFKVLTLATTLWKFSYNVCYLIKNLSGENELVVLICFCCSHCYLTMLNSFAMAEASGELAECSGLFTRRVK